MVAAFTLNFSFYCLFLWLVSKRFLWRFLFHFFFGSIISRFNLSRWLRLSRDLNLVWMVQELLWVQDWLLWESEYIWSRRFCRVRSCLEHLACIVVIVTWVGIIYLLGCKACGKFVSRALLPQETQFPLRRNLIHASVRPLDFFVEGYRRYWNDFVL